LSIKHAILGLLANGPLHGYGLKSAYESELVPNTTLNIGQVYPALDKLEEAGHVIAEKVAQTERPDRKVYTLTEAGRRELESWLSSPSRQDVDLRNETFLKLMLAWRLSQSGGGTGPLKILEAERRSCLERLHELTAQRAQAEKDGAVAALLLLDLAISRLSAFTQWLDRAEEVFRRPGGPRKEG
jgi:DNA-binding PadR family transcriptional regulator